jgi:hypothetical protein
MLEEVIKTFTIMGVTWFAGMGLLFVFLSFYKGGVISFDWEKFSGLQKIKEEDTGKEE